MTLFGLTTLAPNIMMIFDFLLGKKNDSVTVGLRFGSQRERGLFRRTRTSTLLELNDSIFLIQSYPP